MQNNLDLKPNEITPNGKGETIAELAHRHLKDENHVTTEEEIRNARIEFSTPPAQDEDTEKLFEVDNSTVFSPLPGEDVEDEKEKKGKGHNPNPYDVLGS